MIKKCLYKAFLLAIYIFVTLFFCSCSGITVFNQPRYLTKIAGYSVNNEVIEYNVFGKGKNITLILGAIHGNEPASAVLANELRDHLFENPKIQKGKTIIVLSVANPDGLKIGKRVNAHGVDLNRNFPADNRKMRLRYGLYALSEPESSALFNLISKYQPDKIVSIHQPLKCIDYDGPGLQLAQAMAAVCNLPVKKLGAMPGSLGAYTGETLGKPTITLELRKKDTLLNGETLWRLYGNALIAAIKYQKITPVLM